MLSQCVREIKDDLEFVENEYLSLFYGVEIM